MAFRRYKRFRPNIPKPVKVGEEYDVEINEVGSKGDGIARIKNFVVFVNGAKKGEKTRIKITSVMNRFAVGEKVEGEEVQKAEDVTEEEVAKAEAETEESEEG